MLGSLFLWLYPCQLQGSSHSAAPGRSSIVYEHHTYFSIDLHLDTLAVPHSVRYAHRVHTKADLVLVHTFIGEAGLVNSIIDERKRTHNSSDKKLPCHWYRTLFVWGRTFLLQEKQPEPLAYFPSRGRGPPPGSNLPEQREGISLQGQVTRFTSDKGFSSNCTHLIRDARIHLLQVKRNGHGVTVKFECRYLNTLCLNSFWPPWLVGIFVSVHDFLHRVEIPGLNTETRKGNLLVCLEPWLGLKQGLFPELQSLTHI